MLQILLVDDEPYVVDDLSITVPWEELQFSHVHKAYSGQEALEILNSFPIDIVITDITMPELTGLQLIEQIRQQWKHIKCVLLTGYAEFDYAKQALRHQASAYLLKPVSDQELQEVLTRLQTEIREDWEAVSSYRNTMQTFQEHLPLLRDKLLNQILQGKRFSTDHLSTQMEKYKLPFIHGQQSALLIVRLEDYFQKQDPHNIHLFEYAIVNIANEIFSEHFQLWSCKDAHDYLVFLTSANNETTLDEAAMEDRFRSIASQLQRNINTFLKGGVSVVATGWGKFPQDTLKLYQSGVALIRQRIGRETGVFLTADRHKETIETQTLQVLYEPPTFLTLLEASRWDTVEEKLNSVIQELKESRDFSQEHLEETRHNLESAFYYFAHKNNKLLSDLIGNTVYEPKSLSTPDRLKDWALSIIRRLREQYELEHKNLRSSLIHSIHDYVERNIGYVSLQAIADHVSLHPVYLSKIYKTETGSSISEYIHRTKMAKAEHLLLGSPMKIYEISSELGYSSAHYFIKLFKEHRKMTPQEFRDSAG